MLTKILMVCLGNICRSPLAQGILESKLDASKFFVDSAGTASWHQGKKPDPRSIKIAREHGIDISKQKSRPLSLEDFDLFDYILVMDTDNLKDVLSLAPDQKSKDKVKLILDYSQTPGAIVPDPYYGAEDGFLKVYNLLDQACNNFHQQLNK
ncbi:low molecular weight protein-tyrosine-phosphatase [Myroides sp. LJL110]